MRGKIDTSTVLHCGLDTSWHDERLRLLGVREKIYLQMSGTKAGIPEDTMWRLLGTFGLAKGDGRAKQALNVAGRQAKAWGHGYDNVCTTLSESQCEWRVHSSHVLSTKLCSDCVGCPFVVHCCLAPKKCLLEFTLFSDLGLRFQSFCPCWNFDDRAREIAWRWHLAISRSR